VSVERRTPRGEIVESSRALAGFVQTDGKAAIGEPRESAAAKQPLQINYPIKSLGAHPAHTPKNLAPILWFSPTPAIEQNHSRQIGIALEQRREPGFNPPVNIA